MLRDKILKNKNKKRDKKTIKGISIIFDIKINSNQIARDKIKKNSKKKEPKTNKDQSKE